MYCESILFRGAEIRRLKTTDIFVGTSWITLPTKLKKYKINTAELLYVEVVGTQKNTST